MKQNQNIIWSKLSVYSTRIDSSKYRNNKLLQLCNFLLEYLDPTQKILPVFYNRLMLIVFKTNIVAIIVTVFICEDTNTF